VADAARGDIRTFSIDKAAPVFETANKLWASMALPEGTPAAGRS
jgi:hypothetical protein